MDPVVAIVWIGVAVFAATSVITLLYLVGFVPKLPKEHGQLLFKLLVTEVVVASVAAFTYYIQSSVRQDTSDHLPISKLMVIEQSPALVVDDDGHPLYIRSFDVSHARRAVDIQMDLKADFSSSIRATIEAGPPQIISVGERKYRVVLSQMGNLSGDPNEKQARNVDFAFLSISREK
jgi:hypothetical protein